MCFTQNDKKLLELRSNLMLKQEITLEDERLKAATLAVLNPFENFFHASNLHRMHIGTAIAEILENIGFPMPLEIKAVPVANNTFIIAHNGKKLCRLYIKPFHMCFLTDNGNYTYFIDKTGICLKKYENASVQITLKSLSTEKVIFQYGNDIRFFELFVSIPSEMDPSCLWQKLIQYSHHCPAWNLQKLQQDMEKLLNSCFTAYIAKIRFQKDENYYCIVIQRNSHFFKIKKVAPPSVIEFPLKKALPLQVDENALIAIENWLNIVDYRCIMPEYHFYHILKLIGFEDGLSVRQLLFSFGVVQLELSTHEGYVFCIQLSNKKLEIFSDTVSLCFLIQPHIGRGKSQFVQYKLVLEEEKWEYAEKSMSIHFHSDYKAAPKGREVSCMLLSHPNVQILQVKNFDIYKLSELQTEIWNAPNFKRNSIHPILEKYECILKHNSKF